MRIKPALQIKGLIELEVAKDGKIITKRRQGMHSFTGNFLKWLAGFFYTPSSTSLVQQCTATPYLHQIALPYSLIDTTNTGRIIHYPAYLSSSGSVFLGTLGLVAPSGDHTYGVVIGKGTTAPTPSDYKLESQFTEGTGVDQFSHGAVSIEAPTISGNTITTKVVRNFTNNYTATQNVSEAGLIARHYWQGLNFTTEDFKILIARDVLSTPVSVPASATLTLRYVIQVTT